MINEDEVQEMVQDLIDKLNEAKDQVEELRDRLTGVIIVQENVAAMMKDVNRAIKKVEKIGDYMKGE